MYFFIRVIIFSEKKLTVTNYFYKITFPILIIIIITNFDYND